MTIRITFLRTAIFAVSIGVALLSCGLCNASCGEYVFSRHRTPTPHGSDVRRGVARNQQDVLKSEMVGLSKDIFLLHETPLPSPIPCSGPNCQQSPTPSLPIAPPTTVTSGHQDRLICGARAVELPSDVSRRRDLNFHARALRGFPLLIEMPPESVG
ncbi:MAG: hypothetical protein WKF77_15470 [Planctomycetaceae bacterium]